MAQPPILWTRPKQAAEMLGIGMTLLYRWINEGRIVSKKVGNVRLVLISSLADITHDPADLPPPNSRKRRRA